MELRAAIAHVVEGRSLSAEAMAAVMGQLMDGQATAAQTGSLLTALRMKGETVAELVGAARAMRARALPLERPPGILVDTCGTGGDGKGTINISTIAALVVAAAGVRVAKHGNRAASSQAGSADLLEALGVNVASSVAVVERCLHEVGIAFLFAPLFHAGARHVAAHRRELGVRTIFNLLGPLTNPAGATRHVVGVYDVQLLEPVAHALLELGGEHALVVHGHGGYDEFACDGPTEVAEVRGATVRRYRLEPSDFGLEPTDPSSLRGGDAQVNAVAARAILSGERSAGRQCVIMSAAAALYVAGRVDLRANAQEAARRLDDGSAQTLLERLVAASQP